MAEVSRDDLAPRPFAIALAVVGVLALLARLPGLDRSLWYDELFTVKHFAGSLATAVAKQTNANNHPLASVLAFLSSSVFGPSEIALRLPSVLAGTAAVVVLGLAVARISRAAGLAAALLFAAHPAAVAMSQEVRGYALAMLASSMMLALHDASSKRAIALAATTALGLWAHATLGLVVLGVAVALALEKNRRALVALGVGVALALILYSPILSRTARFVGRETGHADDAGGLPTPSRLASVAELFSVADARLSPIPWPAVATVLFVFAALGLVVARKETLGRIALASFIITALAWLAARPLFYPRFLLVLLPLVLALAARGIAAIASWKMTIALALIFAGALGLATRARASWETQNIRGAVELAKRLQPDVTRRAVGGLGSELLDGFSGENIQVQARSRGWGNRRKQGLVVVDLGPRFLDDNGEDLYEEFSSGRCVRFPGLYLEIRVYVVAFN